MLVPGSSTRLAEEPAAPLVPLGPDALFNTAPEGEAVTTPGIDVPVEASGEDKPARKPRT